MLFMGEEWGSTQPFFYFTDFAGDLAEAVRAGRRAEFARFPEFRDPEAQRRIPDPNTFATFDASKLRWADAASAEGRQWRDWYRRILAVRRAEVVPLLAAMGGHAGSYEVLDAGLLRVRWTLADGRALHLAANLGDTARPMAPAAGRTLWVEGAVGDGRAGPWNIVWTLTGEEP
jgi:1,4-alpha-glucan branching enzyme